MKKTLIIGIALAASALTACSSGTDGAATTSSTSSAAATGSSSAATGATSSMTSDEATSDEPTSDEPTSDQATADAGTSDETSADSTAEPVTLDAQSVAWFGTFCSSITSIEASSQTMGSMKPDATAAPTDQQATLAAGVTDYGDTFKKAASDIAALPPATIDGGDELATGATTAFDQIGDAMIAAADKFAATPVTDEASLQAAATTLGTDVQASAAGIQESLAPLDAILTPELGAAVQEIPGCEDVASS